MEECGIVSQRIANGKLWTAQKSPSGMITGWTLSLLDKKFKDLYLRMLIWSPFKAAFPTIIGPYHIKFLSFLVLPKNKFRLSQFLSSKQRTLSSSSTSKTINSASKENILISTPTRWCLIKGWTWFGRQRICQNLDF